MDPGLAIELVALVFGVVVVVTGLIVELVHDYRAWRAQADAEFEHWRRP